MAFDRDFTLPTDGTYLLAVQSRSSVNTINYSFRLINSETISNRLTLGETVSSDLSELGETDIYTFTGTVGQRLYFDGLDSNFATNAQLFSPTRNNVFFNSSTSSDSNPFTLTEAGTYQLRLTGNIGAYNFRLLDLNSASNLAFDTVTNGTLNPGQQTDVFKFTGTAGQRLFFDGLGTQSGGSFIVYGPNNQVLNSTNLTSDREITLTSDGTYFLVAAGSNNTSISYSFEMVTPETSTTAINLGETVNGNISEPGEIDIFTFTANAGQRLYYDGLTGNSFIDASLLSPSGASLFSFQDSNGNRAPITLIESGTYQIRLDSSDATTGAYSFRLLEGATAQNLPFDTTITQTLNPGTSTALYQFTGTKNQTLFLDSLGTTGDGSIVFYRPDGKIFTSKTLDFDGEIILPGNGTYLVAVEGTNASNPVNYRFRLFNSATVPTPPEAPILDLVASSDTGVSNTDNLTKDITPTLQITAEAGSTVKLFQNGIEIRETIANELGLAEFTLETLAYGSYHFTATATDVAGNTSSLSSVLTVRIDITEALNFGATVNGNLGEPGEQNIYTFTGTSGQRLFFDGLDSNSGISARLINPFGNNALFSTSTSSDSNPFTLTEAGTYQLRLTGNIGAYNFRLLDLNSASNLAFDTVTNGTLNPGRETDLFEFTGTAGQRLFLDGLGTQSGGSFIVYGPNNQLINSTNLTSDMDITLTSDGTYFLLAAGSNNTSVSYSFEMVTPQTSTTAINLGETVNGNISERGELDIFTFTANAGQRLYFNGLDSNFTTIANLLSPTGNNAFFRTSTSSDSSPFTLTEVGNYQLRITGNTGDYSFRLLNLADAEVLTLDTTITRTLDPKKQTDIFTFKGTANQRLFLDVLGDTSASYSIYEPNNQLITFKTIFDSDFTLPTDGTYLLAVQGSSVETINYSFRLLDLNDVTDLAVDTVTNGTLNPGRETDLFEFTGTAGQRLFLDGLGTQFGGSIVVYGPNGQFIASRTSGFDGYFTLPTDGTYLLAVRGSSVETINYSFRLTHFETINNPLTLGETVSSNLSKLGETDIYTFTGTVGQRLYFDGLDSNLEHNIKLFSPTRNNVFFNSSTSSDSNPFTLTEAGTYQLRLTGNIGAYNFRLLDLNSASNLAFDTVTNGTLNPGQQTDVFKFTGTAGQRLFFDGLGTQSGGSFIVYGPNNQVLNSTNLTSDREITLTSDGTYFLVAAGSNNTSISYSFEMVTPETSTTAINLGETVNGNISEPGEIDIFTFTANAGQRLYYDGLTGNSFIDASLLSPSGASLFSFQDSNGNRAPITLIESGTYQIRLDSSDATTGAYSFRLLEGATAQNLPFDTTITQTLNPGTSTALYQFTGTKNQTLFLDSLGTTGDGSIVFYRPDGKIFTSKTLDFDGEIILRRNGTYLVTVEGTNASNPVNYSFRLNEP
ncbi:Ig-like domain-containing protein [Aphanothece sacrum]|uniref:Ig-like domain-containing protein n=1 Tax=Aphanothece sacrum TaxID=1122 RepID=UPI000F60BD15|nr:Ig-like domain-containing protein [Aphanothece sacrum]GBF86366.1 hypothetical protein AsFPU3_3437 [Aphanothece sacrum FPU3]